MTVFGWSDSLPSYLLIGCVRQAKSAPLVIDTRLQPLRHPRHWNGSTSERRWWSTVASVRDLHPCGWIDFCRLVVHALCVRQVSRGTSQRFIASPLGSRGSARKAVGCQLVSMCVVVVGRCTDIPVLPYLVSSFMIM